MAGNGFRVLSAEQRASYDENGFVVVDDVLQPSACEELSTHFMDIQLGRKTPEWHKARDPEALPAVYWKRYFNTHRVDDLSMQAMRLGFARDALWDLMDCEPVGLQSMFFFKAPGTPGQAAHQDTNYIPSDPESLTACWLALDDADEQNGTMWVVPGSHRGPLRSRGKVEDTDEYEDWTDELEGVREMPEVPVIAPAGSAVFFHGRLIHRSTKNRTSDRFRRVFVCHYVSKGAKVTRPDLQEQVTLF